MKLQRILAVLVVYAAFHIALSSPIKDRQSPHVIKRQANLEDYYRNEHLPLGFFIDNGEEAGNGAAQQRVALFGSGSRNYGSGKAEKKSQAPKNPK